MQNLVNDCSATLKRIEKLEKDHQDAEGQDAITVFFDLDQELLNLSHSYFSLCNTLTDNAEDAAAKLEMALKVVDFDDQSLVMSGTEKLLRDVVELLRRS